jgi:SAM-dependent methyltransferase
VIDEAGTSYDRRWENYTEATLAPLLAYLEDAPPPSGARILDVGCGTGVFLERIARAHRVGALAGLDPSSAMLTAAVERLGKAGYPTRGLVQGSSEALPFRAGSFDVSVSTNSLHFWPDPGAGLREIAKVLGPGGRLVLVDWSGDSLPMRILDVWLRFRDPAHNRVLGGRELVALLRTSGFQVNEVLPVRSHGLWRHLLVDAVVSIPFSNGVSHPGTRPFRTRGRTPHVIPDPDADPDPHPDSAPGPHPNADPDPLP